MDAEEWIESFSRGTMCLLGIVGNNWLAFSSLPRSRSQLKTNDALFINLAVSNLITNYLVDLPDTMADFNGGWFMGLPYCRVFRFCADLSETSSIFSTLFISVFWYQKLVGSLKRGGAPVRLDNLRLVAALLAGSWTVAIAFSIPHLIFVEVGTGEEGDDEVDCLDAFPSPATHQVYEILYLSLANAVPIAGIVFASIQIVVTLMRNQQRIRGTGEPPPAPASLPDKPQGGAADTTPPAGQPPQQGSSAPTGASGEAVQQQQPQLQAAAKAVVAQAKAGPSAGGQVRAAKSVVAVASVFLVCWLTHLLLRITSNVQASEVVVEVASYIAASYTCIIPYIFLHGVKKLNCHCCCLR
ncbi:annetocin receptor [Engraulis encrasicolus]|uniref:annetocin receptor n=1 Tax=Engraulis encrasicolus TaxID=184585 RepID=UPI002FD0076D